MTEKTKTDKTTRFIIRVSEKSRLELKNKSIQLGTDMASMVRTALKEKYDVEI